MNPAASEHGREPGLTNTQAAADAPRPLILWGAGGQAIVLREFMEKAGWKVIALFDNNPNLSAPFPDVPAHVGREGFARWKKSWGEAPVAGLVAIGSSGQARMEIQAHMESQGVEIVQAIHPTAYVAGDAVLGKGCQILAQTVVAASARLGQQCIINTAASIDHETVLGDGIHIAPGARLAGCIRVGDFTFVGLGAIVLPRLTIGRNCVIGAGSLVTKDVPDNVVVYGSPARVVRGNLT